MFVTSILRCFGRLSNRCFLSLWCFDRLSNRCFRSLSLSK